jgi:hypothetical protein
VRNSNRKTGPRPSSICQQVNNWSIYLLHCWNGIFLLFLHPSCTIKPISSHKTLYRLSPFILCQFSLYKNSQETFRLVQDLRVPHT